ncbi:dihydrolipoamide acetyltransferase family protein [Maricaulis maris]|uniref:Dihydrolipoamide acetyltransferase component of pyruvate dehydrogenase complex n=1 Tax=Maricaulis maris TaxID=74318 RepID=A0A495DMF5_9PROT|nr:dihydrolipoamide acetyltransferase family protein [Maricaulis maris]RKR04075.1 branched-chain alpha-keto acid dehydrogenase E2 component [Maricaulis maris]
MSEYRYKMPDVGEGIVEAEIVEWHVKEGDTVTEDQHVLDVMTDKATVEIPCAVNGKVTKLVGAPGDVIAVGTEIMFIAVDSAVPAEAEAPAQAEAKAEPAKPAAPKAAEPVAAAEAPSIASRTGGERPLASPAVRKRALESDIRLANVPGTGPAGRITHDDLDDFIKSGGRLVARSGSGSSSVRAPRTGVTEEKVIGLRRRISENMSHVQRTVPDIAYVEEIDVTALEELRGHLNASKSDDQAKLTFIPFLVMALTKALPDTPQANAHFDGEAMLLTKHDAVHCGVAAATPNGLMVPVIKHAESLDIWQIAAELKRLAGAAKDGKATKDELTGSTITITSLGAIGGLVTTPILNAPETAIIGVNKMQTLPRFNAEGQVVPRKLMNLSSCFDHRIVDGYEAAMLIQAVKGYLENPATLFM